jgi:hypothetical protein
VCLWFLKELLKKKQAKVVRQAEIKTSVSEYVLFKCCVEDNKANV